MVCLGLDDGHRSELSMHQVNGDESESLEFTPSMLLIGDTDEDSSGYLKADEDMRR